MDKSLICIQITTRFYIDIFNILFIEIEKLIKTEITRQGLSEHKVYSVTCGNTKYSNKLHVEHVARAHIEISEENRKKLNMLHKLNIQIQADTVILKNYVTNLLNYCESYRDIDALLPSELTDFIILALEPMTTISPTAHNYQISNISEIQTKNLNNFIKQKEFTNLLLRNLKL